MIDHRSAKTRNSQSQAYRQISQSSSDFDGWLATARNIYRLNILKSEIT